MKKLLTLILAISMIASLAVVASAGTGNTLPKNILGKDFETKLLCDFSEGSFTGAKKKDDNHPLSTDGEKLSFNLKSNYTEATITLKNAVDPAGYAGVLVYVDSTEMTELVQGEKTVGDKKFTDVHYGFSFGVRLFFDGLDALGDNSAYAWTRDNDKDSAHENKYINDQNKDFEIAGYYLEDGVWKKAKAEYFKKESDQTNQVDPTTGDGERIQYPANYKGWIYVPFTSYITRRTEKGVSNPIIGLPSGQKITKVYPLLGNYTTNEAKNVYVDDIMLVKFVEKSADTLDATSVAVACVAIAGAAAAFTFGKKKKF